MFVTALSLFLLAVSAKSSSSSYKLGEAVSGFTVTSISEDKYGSQHIIIDNTTLDAWKNGSETLAIYEKNPDYQHFENPNNYTIIPYFTYVCNVTASYANPNVSPKFESLGFYIDQSKKWGDVVDLDGQQVTINITSTPELIALTNPEALAGVLAQQFVAAAEHELVNNVAFIQLEQFHIKFLFDKTGLKQFSQTQVEILHHVFYQFFLVHEEYGSVPGIILRNFDGDGNTAYITFAHSEKEFENIRIVEEEDFAYVAQH